MVQGVTRDFQARKAKKDTWVAVSSIDDLINIVEGLAGASRRLLHRSVLSAENPYILGRRLKDVWTEYDGRACVDGLYSAMKTRLAEHAAAARLCITADGKTPPPLEEWGTRSSIILDKVTGAAKSASRDRYAYGVPGDGKTAIGKGLTKLEGID